VTEFKNPPANSNQEMDGICHPLLSLAPLEAHGATCDTWITVGDPVDGPTEERTVTVVFRRDLDEEGGGTDDALLHPFEPTFPGHR